MGLEIRILSDADLGFADEVRAIAGWNQLLGDWRRLLALEPEGCFLAEVDGKPAGTATVTCYGTELAWIGMVLVHPEFRRRGVGTALLKHAIRVLREERGVRCVKLDATADGRPLYEKLGFRAEWGLKRWLWKEGVEGPGSASPAPGELGKAALRGDREVFGADRSCLLSMLARDGLAVIDRGEDGFGLLRDGARSVYLGPVTAADRETGEGIVRELLGAAGRERWIFWDIPDGNEPVVELARRLGFEPVRELTRMWLGENASPGDPTKQWAIADFALG